MQQTRPILRLSLVTIALIACLCAAVHPGPVQAAVIINELMAVNSTTLQDEDGDYPDWIELLNTGTATVNLTGWHLTDNATDLTKWTFPATNLPAGGYMVVFASDKNRTVPGAALHTDFKLSSDGEYLGLTRPDASVEHEYAPAFPPQSSDLSYGYPAGLVTDVFIDAGTACRALVPTDGSLALTWTSNAFDDSGWASGTTGVGYERSSGYESMIGLDVETPMYGNNCSCYVRVPFVVPSVQDLAGLVLDMTFDDGYFAYVNGRKSVGANNPEDLSWNTNSTTVSSEAEQTVFDLSALLGVLVDGTNVLAVHGLNQSLNSSDFLILPRLTGVRELSGVSNAATVLATPTPGAVNAAPYVQTVDKPRFTAWRGYYEAPFSLSITCATEGATIRYTTDFTEPTDTHGTMVTGPIWISQTTCVRARASKAGWLSSECLTRSFIFLQQVVTQANNQAAAGFPSTWVTRDGTTINADYGMDQRVIGPSDNYGGIYRASITNDLRSIPVLSIVTTMDNLFDQTIGIYANPQGYGDNWERPCSLEYFNDPRDTNGVQVNCGLRIHGEINRRPTNPKHSLRVLFKSMYGDAKFDYNLFEDDPVASFNTLVLRGMQGDSWVGRDDPAFIREQWAQDTQRAMGHPSPHAKLVHLYLNGLYWGLFNIVERPDDAFMEDRVAEPRENWDILQGLITSAEVTLAEGSRAAYDAMMALVPKTPTTPISASTYAQLVQYLDMPRYVEYMLLQFYSQNYDWPRKNWKLASQRNPADPAGPPAVKFRYNVWDQERTIGFYGQDRTGVGGDIADRVGPVQVYTRVRGLRAFQRLFGDRAQRVMFNGGALTTVSNYNRWVYQMDLVKGAVVAESARWGDVRTPSTPFTLVDWYDTMGDKTNNWFPLRNAVLLSDLRGAGLYPSIDAPAFNQHGGYVGEGFDLEISAPQGTIYYTTDGSDPANEDDTIGATATAYAAPFLLADNVRIRARAKDGTTWSALVEAVFKVRRPSLRVTELMYHPPPPPAASPYNDEDFEFIELMNAGTTEVSVSHVAIRGGVTFDISNRYATLAPGECLVIAKNLAAFGTRYTTGGYALVGGYDSQLANGGEMLAIDDPLYGEIQGFTYDDQWYPGTDGGGYSLTIVDPFGTLDQWNVAQGWRASSQVFGSPGYAIPEPAAMLALALCGLWSYRRRMR